MIGFTLLPLFELLLVYPLPAILPITWLHMRCVSVLDAAASGVNLINCICRFSGQPGCAQAFTSTLGFRQTSWLLQFTVALDPRETVLIPPNTLRKRDSKLPSMCIAHYCVKWHLWQPPHTDSCICTTAAAAAPRTPLTRAEPFCVLLTSQITTTTTSAARRSSIPP